MRRARCLVHIRKERRREIDIRQVLRRRHREINRRPAESAASELREIEVGDVQLAGVLLDGEVLVPFRLQCVVSMSSSSGQRVLVWCAAYPVDVLRTLHHHVSARDDAAVPTVARCGVGPLDWRRAEVQR